MSRASVSNVIASGRGAHSAIITLGDAVDDLPRFGPRLSGPFAPIGWIIAGQVLALVLARAAGIDSDTPRGLHKFLG